MFKYNKALSMGSTRKIFGTNTATCLVKINVNFSNVPCYIVLLILFQVNLRYLKITYRNFRVWKGILGIRDLTKIRCGIRENEKYLHGIRDLTVTTEAGFTKIWARDAGFCCLSVGNSGKHHDPKNLLAAKANQPG